MAKCPLCGPYGEGITIHIHVTVEAFTWRDALKLRLAGPEARRVLLDEISLRFTEMAMNRWHPENEL